MLSSAARAVCRGLAPSRALLLRGQPRTAPLAGCKAFRGVTCQQGREFSLASILKRERAEEEEAESSEMPPDLKELLDRLQDKGISLKDEAGKNTVRLYGSGVGAEKVMVEFDCQDEEEDWGDMDMDEEQEQGEGDEEEPETQPAFRFRATVSKGSEKLVVHAVATDQVRVDSVACCPPGADPDDEELYQGPGFDELEPDLQESVMAYLQERHIDDDLATFICMYADHKEQAEYINWLDKFHSFATK